MLQFILNLLYTPEEETRADLPLPAVPTALSGDKLGRRLHSYHESLRDEERDMVAAVLPTLLKIGSNSRPPKDWQPLLRLAHWHNHDRTLLHLSTEWWNILQRVLVNSLSEQPMYLKSARNKSSETLDRRSLPIIRGIVWLHLYFQHAQAAHVGVQLMSQCMENYPNSGRIYEDIAVSVAYYLKRQPYFKAWKQRIPVDHPELMQGRLKQIFV